MAAPIPERRIRNSQEFSKEAKRPNSKAAQAGGFNVHGKSSERLGGNEGPKRGSAPRDLIRNQSPDQNKEKISTRKSTRIPK